MSVKLPPEVKNALVSMGYRPMDATRNVWGKPVAISLFTYEHDRLEITQWFKGVDGTLGRWDSWQLDLCKDYLGQIKYAERCGSYFSGGHSEFEFLSKEDQANEACGILYE